MMKKFILIIASLMNAAAVQSSVAAENYSVSTELMTPTDNKEPLAPEQLKQLVRDEFRDVVENMNPTQADLDKYTSKDYVQHVDGKTLDYDDLIAHMRAQKKALKSVKIVFHDMVAEGNKVATRHTAYAIKKDGKEVEVLVIAIFEFNKEGKVISCNELTHLVRGEASDRDLGSRK